ncbi:MAG: hypothetical protein C3F13_03075 [Anaerolineales bacterium]|nr:MAG: hypothetical protein C3F13_03075 [Anaerolineales bacterium]
MAEAQVECRSDHDYIGRPLAFYWQDQRVVVEAVLLDKRIPTGYSFLVLTEKGDRFELDYDIDKDQWSVHQK